MATTLTNLQKYVESIGLTWVSRPDRNRTYLDVTFRDRRLEGVFYTPRQGVLCEVFYYFRIYANNEQFFHVDIYHGLAGPALSVLFDVGILEDAGRLLEVRPRVRHCKLSYALVGPGKDKRTLGDDPVFRDWIAGEVTDGMLLDYVWDLFGWS